MSLQRILRTNSVPSPTTLPLPRPRVILLALGVLLQTAAGSQLRAAEPPAPRIQTVAGNGSTTINGTRGAAADFAVAQPFGVAVGPDSALYITEVGNHRVLRLDRATGKIQCVAGTGVKGYQGDGGPALQAQLNEPYEVRFDQAGNMYFVEMKNHLVRRVDAASGTISTIAGTGVQGYGGDGGPAIAAQLNNPHSIDLDRSGSLYIADIGNHRIRRVDLKKGTIETIAGTGQRELPRAGQPARGQPVLGPRALFVEDDTLWVALREGHSVWALSLKNGTWRHVAGRGDKGYTGDGGPAMQATFNGPKGIAADGRGNLLVVDTENQVIRRIRVAQGTIDTVCGSGPQNRGFGGDGGPATAAKLDRPHGIIAEADGTVYIGDTLNHRVRKFHLPNQ